VEGREQVRRVVCGVTASKALIEAAIQHQADALLVHHGWFWKSEDGRVTGFRRQRMARLLAHDISLFAYHLPLDAHPRLGNNAQLAARMGWTVEGRFAEQDIGFFGVPPAPTSVAELSPGRTPWAASRCWSVTRNGSQAHRLVQRRSAGLLRRQH
jgi:putative NIF3 family GTP cyclohydrolase 1 type 2